ncbi:Non-ribosomal peptide synthetase, partial [Chytridiales sp. JEL 0842]
MVPAWVVPMSTLPLTPSKKIDERSLQAMFAAMDIEALQQLTLYDAVSSHDNASHPDWNNSLETVRTILSAASKVSKEEILPSSSIFHLGLDSVSAVQVSSLFQKQGIAMPVSKILQNRTVEQMVAYIVQNGNSTASTHLSSANSRNILREHIYATLGPDFVTGAIMRLRIDSKEDIEALYPCTPGQIFAISGWMASKGSQFASTFVLRTNEALDSARLEQAFHALVTRHEIFRTAFLSTASNSMPLVQVVLKDKAVNSTLWSDEGFAMPMEENTVMKFVEKELRLTPGLGRPPIRLKALTFSDATVLILTLHHALYDGWSLQLFSSELEAIYLLGEPSGFETPLLSQFILDSVVQSEPAEENSLSDNAYWHRLLSNAQPTLFPALNSSASSSGRTRIFMQDVLSNASDVEKRLNGHGVTLQTAIMAAWAKTLGTVCLSPNVLFGMYHAGRTEKTERLLAPCFNVIPAFASGCNQKSLIQLAQEFQDMLGQLSKWKAQVNLREVQKWAGYPHRPMFNTYFNFLKSSVESSASGSESLLKPCDLSDQFSSDILQSQRQYADSFEKASESVANNLAASSYQ